ncbi:MAG: CHRD domain-containing protein [Vicinamibacterales bacterium]
MKKIVMVTTAVLVLVGAAMVVARENGAKRFREVMSGVKEVPVVSSSGHGVFTASINEDETAITYRLEFEGLNSNIAQSHIHIGPPNNTGAIDLFLCTNLGNAPAGQTIQACPLNATEGVIEGVLTAANVIPLPAQGIAANELDEVIALMRAGVTYVNIHTVTSPAGEIRSQVHSHLDNSGH